MKHITLSKNGTTSCVSTTRDDVLFEIAVFILWESNPIIDTQHRFLSIAGTHSTLALLAQREEKEFDGIRSFVETITHGIDNADDPLDPTVHLHQHRLLKILGASTTKAGKVQTRVLVDALRRNRSRVQKTPLHHVAA